MNSSPRKLRDRQRAETRAEIIRVAFDLFGRHGYAEVPVEMIAAEAGISRATFFNYFPQKDLLLREIANARVARLKSILTEVRSTSPAPTLGDVVEMILKLTRENARISLHSKQLLLATVFGQTSRGFLLTAREHAIEVMTESLRAAPDCHKDPHLVAETLFAVYMATMLEWLMREGVPENWLADAMHNRLNLVMEGVA
jgi:AcrR family transcriptional regulator